ncbi:MAG: hypothetical protein JO142_12255 [Burkholderiales bacterium]|nr:hypothetical protein [Burkholderiales bacterium]
MTTSNEQAAKLPLIKRLVIAVRGGVGGGLSAVLIVALVGLAVLLGLGGFFGGVAMATKRHQMALHAMGTQLHDAKAALAKLQAAHEDTLKQLADQKSMSDAKQAETQQLREQITELKAEKEAMDKVLTEIHDSLSAPEGGKSKAKDVDKVVQGARLKFGNSECNMQGSAVSSKKDVDCLNLRDAIGAMNGKPGGYSDPNAKPGDSKPAK